MKKVSDSFQQRVPANRSAVVWGWGTNRSGLATDGVRVFNTQPFLILIFSNPKTPGLSTRCGWSATQPRSNALAKAFKLLLYPNVDKLRKQQPGLPYNPGLRELIDGKRRGTQPLQIQQEKQGFRGWHERGYLPHRDEPGMTQFVTFRLADSFPESRRSEWEHLWKIESDQQRRIKLEAYLDRGRGECHLRDPAVADLVVKGLLFFQARKYNLLSWCIMPNHVHALFKVTDVPMSEIMASWKKHTAQKANRILNRRGKFWEEDYWDTYMRDAEQERKSVRYIENNPTKAKLVRAPEDWRWSSARYRDKFGKLQI